MDKLPNDLIARILKYAMQSDVPCFLDDFIQAGLTARSLARVEGNDVTTWLARLEKDFILENKRQTCHKVLEGQLAQATAGLARQTLNQQSQDARGHAPMRRDSAFRTPRQVGNDPLALGPGEHTNNRWASQMAQPDDKEKHKRREDQAARHYFLDMPQDYLPNYHTDYGPEMREENAPQLSRVYLHLHWTQRSHMLDWWLTSVCKRFYDIGRPLFLSSKPFLMGPSVLEDLRRGTIKIAPTVREAAILNISTVMLVGDLFSRASVFVALPRNISAFPSLTSLYFLREYSGYDALDLTRGGLRLRRPPGHFIDALGSIGVPVDRVNVSIIVHQRERWDDVERGLREQVYPALKSMADIKAKTRAVSNAISGDA